MPVIVISVGLELFIYLMASWPPLYYITLSVVNIFVLAGHLPVLKTSNQFFG